MDGGLHPAPCLPYTVGGGVRDCTWAAPPWSITYLDRHVADIALLHTGCCQRVGLGAMPHHLLPVAPALRRRASRKGVHGRSVLRSGVRLRRGLPGVRPLSSRWLEAALWWTEDASIPESWKASGIIMQQARYSWREWYWAGADEDFGSEECGPAHLASGASQGSYSRAVCSYALIHPWAQDMGHAKQTLPVPELCH